ncbi:MAG: hypothetical protein H0V10_13125 [Geodermatophilaceae bacterium]|nr:hypothetical protein [Geodermatophilaceae bacterium]
MAELAGLTFLVWFLVSAVAQLPGPITRRIRSVDAIGVIPSWSFFAPNPVRTDSHLVYRHILDSGIVTDWTEVFVWQAPPTRWIWNPDRRVEKAISDASSHLSWRKDVTGVQWSTPYLLLLSHVSGLPQTGAAAAVQFALLGSFGHQSGKAPFVRFVSDCHPLDDRLGRRSVDGTRTH